MTSHRVLLRPSLIVPEQAEGKLTIAEEGSIVELMDMHTMFRDRVSPITRRADEILVRFGKPGKEGLGWIARNGSHSMKSVKGPIFLVKTKEQKKMTPWDRIRFAVARADARQLNKRRWWLVPWCVIFSDEHIPDIKKTIREFGGIPKKSEDPDVLCQQLTRVILKQEIDMASARSEVKGKKNKKTAKVEKKSTKKSKTKDPKDLPKATAKNFNPRSSEFDSYVIKRLIEENPRRAGTSSAKRWDIIKKGMSVGEYVKKGGKRSSIRKYLKKEWIKLLRPKE